MPNPHDKQYMDNYGIMRPNPDYVGPDRKKLIPRIVAAVLAAAFFIGLIAFATACGTVAQDEVGYAVGGGPLDGQRHKVKGDMLLPGRHITGTLDSMWTLPSNNTVRFQDFAVDVTSKDGKKVHLEGQMGFRFVGEKDPVLSKKFVTGVGARKYGKDKQRPGEGDDGWEAFLDTMVTREINATLKDGVGKVYCADFEPACRSIDPRKDVPESNPEGVYEALNGVLSTRIDKKLGGAFLQDIRIGVATVALPPEVQSNIDAVTAEQAKTKAAEQSVKTADAEAQAIVKKSAALKKSPQAVAVEVAKNCKGSCSIILDTTGKGVQPSVGAR